MTLLKRNNLTNYTHNSVDIKEHPLISPIITRATGFKFMTYVRRVPSLYRSKGVDGSLVGGGPCTGSLEVSK